MRAVLFLEQYVRVQRRHEAGHGLPQNGEAYDVLPISESVYTLLSLSLSLSLPPHLSSPQAKICKDPVVIYKHMLENNIGTYCALFYDTYAIALSEQGKVDEAVKLVKQGLAQNAQPMKKLQKRLDLLKQSPESQGGAPTLSAAVTTSKTERQTASSTWQDEQV